MPTPELTFEQRFEAACRGIRDSYMDKIMEQSARIEDLEMNNHLLQTMLRRTYDGKMPPCMLLLLKSRRG